MTASDVALPLIPVDESSVNDFTMLKEAVAVDDTTVEFHRMSHIPFGHTPWQLVGIVPYLSDEKLRTESNWFRTLYYEAGTATAGYFEVKPGLLRRRTKDQKLTVLLWKKMQPWQRQCPDR